jgi:hypothetical protein
MQGKRRLVCLVAAMVLLAASAQVCPAAGIVLKNQTEEDFEGIYCVDDQGATKQVAGELDGGASVKVSPNKFPENECNRIAVLLGGKGWQFYHEPEPGAASEMVFSMEEYRPETDEYPSLLITSDGESYVSPAGVPLGMLVQAMEFGMDEAKWKEIAVPDVDPKENTEFAVSFADQSWNMHDEGLVFKELVEGKQLAAAISLKAYFGNAVVAAIFEGLKGFGCVPAAFTLDDQTAKLDGAMDGDAKWEAMDKYMAKAAGGDGGDVRILFGSGSFTVTLELDLDNSVAVLVIKRKEGAAFG